MEQGTINQGVTFKHNSDTKNLVVSKSGVIKDAFTDVYNKANENESRINAVDDRVTDAYKEIKANKEIIEELFVLIKWIEKVFIISFSLIVLIIAISFLF